MAILFWIFLKMWSPKSAGFTAGLNSRPFSLWNFFSSITSSLIVLSIATKHFLTTNKVSRDIFRIRRTRRTWFQTMVMYRFSDRIIFPKVYTCDYKTDAWGLSQISELYMDFWKFAESWENRPKIIVSDFLQDFWRGKVDFNLLGPGVFSDPLDFP